jgi:hypothetical protein
MTRRSKTRKLSADRRSKLDRVHARDCPGMHSIEFSCLTCVEILARAAEEQRRKTA